MPIESSSLLRERFKAFSRFASALISLIGMFILLGWCLDNPNLKQLIPGHGVIPGSSAIAFLLAGLAVCLLSAPREYRAARLLSQGLSLLLAVAGLLTLYEDISGLDLSLDNVVYRKRVESIGITFPGPMALNVSLNFLLIGLAMLALNVKKKKAVPPFQALTLGAAVISMMALIGYAYGVPSLCSIGGCVKMPLATALLFALLCAAVFASRPNRGITAILSRNSMGGTLARRFSFAVLVVPLVLGWLRLSGEAAGLYDPAFGLAVLVLLAIVILTALIFRDATTIDIIDSARSQAENVLQHSLDQLRDLYNNAPCGYHSLDEDGLIMRMNDTELAWLGYTRDELVGEKRFSDLLTPESLSKYKEQFEHLKKTGYAGHLEFELVRRDGTTIPVLINASTVKDQNGQILSARSTVFDLSERTKLLQQRADLMATLAHDLKVPLIGAVRALEALLNGAVGKLAPGQSQVLRLLKQSNENLLRTIHKLLDVYHYEMSGQDLSFTELDLNSVVTDTLADLTPLANLQALELTSFIPDDLPRISANPDAMRRLLVNLLENAIKFTPAGGKIQVTASGLEDAVALQIKDTGRGIPQEDLSKLFDRFWQGEPGKKYLASTGLGLYLCKQIVESHQGEITCTSQVDSGTVFNIVLPTHQNNGSRAKLL